MSYDITNMNDVLASLLSLVLIFVNCFAWNWIKPKGALTDVIAISGITCGAIALWLFCCLFRGY
jgi:hypothetical protein